MTFNALMDPTIWNESSAHVNPYYIGIKSDSLLYTLDNMFFSY